LRPALAAAILLVLAPALLPAEALYSPSWGFALHLPPGYALVEGNGFDRFSFRGPSGAMFDLLVYDGVYSGVGEMMDDAALRLSNEGSAAFFDYGGKRAAIMNLDFGGFEGMALGLELAETARGSVPLLLALAYASRGTENVELLHVSALNSLAPTAAHARLPGPVMTFAFPRGEPVDTPLAGGLGLSAAIREGDAYAAQWLVDNEFLVLTLFMHSNYWQEAWVRFYRAIFRDSWDRIADAAFRLERAFRDGGAVRDPDPAVGDLALARRALSFVQGFVYERDFEGSDFVNMVSAVTEGRGDCDSRAMLWAMILAQANVPSAIMVSRLHSHAMGLADLPGEGARFEAGGTRWLVAETIVPVDIGLIAADMSDPANWLGVLFE